MLTKNLKFDIFDIILVYQHFKYLFTSVSVSYVRNLPFCCTYCLYAFGILNRNETPHTPMDIDNGLRKLLLPLSLKFELKLLKRSRYVLQ
jgi:hypothetical protein